MTTAVANPNKKLSIIPALSLKLCFFIYVLAKLHQGVFVSVARMHLYLCISVFVCVFVGICACMYVCICL